MEIKMPQGKKGAVVLAFDDNAPTHLDFVIPELVRRQIVGTFYVIPASEGFQNRRTEWERAVDSPFIQLGNHTFTHRGVQNAAELERELAQANEALRGFYPELPWPRLQAFARPGGVPWEVSEDEVQESLRQHHLVRRPLTANPIVKGQPLVEAGAELLAIVEDVLANGGLRQFVFHGVGGDWHSTSAEYFLALLDKLEAHREELWITEPVALHQFNFG